MEDDETISITEAGVEESVDILIREGYLITMPDDTDYLAQIALACEKYVAASIAKGSARSWLECRDALLIGFFQAWVEDQRKSMVN